MSAQRSLAAWYFAYFAFIGAFLPYFTLYLESLGSSPAEIGILMSIGQVMRMLVPALWGWFSDRSGRRTPIIKWSAVLSLLSFSAYFAAENFSALLLATVLLHLFWTGALPLVEALTFQHIHDAPDRYGRIRLWGSLGFIVAVSGVGVLLDAASIGSLLWVGWVLLFAVAAVAWMLHEAPANPGRITTEAAQGLRDTRVWVLLLAGFLMAAAHGPFYVFYSIHLVGNGYDKTTAGALWSLGVIAEILVFLWMPRLSRRFDLRQILLACFSLAVLRFLLIGWRVESLGWLVFAQVLHAATFGAHHAATVSALNRWFGSEQQGRVQALYGSLSFGAGGMFGAVLAGQVWERAGAGASYSFASGLALAGFLVIAGAMPRTAPRAGPRG